MCSRIYRNWSIICDDDDDDDDDELFLWYGWPTKGVYPYFQLGPLSEILTISNLRHAVSSIWTYTEPGFRLCWMKLFSSDNHYTMAPHTSYQPFHWKPIMAWNFGNLILQIRSYQILTKLFVANISNYIMLCLKMYFLRFIWI